MSNLSDFVVKNRKPLLIFNGLLIIVVSLGITQIKLDDTWTKYFDERFEDEILMVSFSALSQLKVSGGLFALGGFASAPSLIHFLTNSTFDGDTLLELGGILPSLMRFQRRLF